jgi:hypothetical protein
MCPNQGAHLASCTKCAEGFEIISELGNILKKQLADLQNSYAVKYATVDASPDSLLNANVASNSTGNTTAELSPSAVLKARRLAELALLEDSSGDEDSSDAGNSPDCDDDGKTDAGQSKNNGDGQHTVPSAKKPPVSSVTPTASNNKTPSPAVVNDWNSKTNAVLKEECRRHALAVSGTKTTLVARIIAYEKRTKARDQDAVLLHKLSTEELLALQSLEELIYEISCRKEDLVEFRSHLARHKSEEEYATKELEDLLDDEAIVTADFKMKILSCFFRENQKKWFGKRGTSMLGFMITTNPKDPDEKANGMKDVSFVMMVTDDSLQDEHEVACAKAMLYSQYLPEHITKVRFVSDGAGCFKSQYHRAFQPFWKIWTGIDEISYRITPAGDGKSNLDGMFGRLNVVLATSVNGGQSYYNSETVCEAIEDSNGLAATEFCRFEPERIKKVEVDIVGMSLESILLTTLDQDRGLNDHSTRAFKHSGFGSGVMIDPINPTSGIKFGWRKITGKKKKLADLTEIKNVYYIDVCIG